MILEEVAEYLETNVLDLSRGDNLFAGILPETPSTCAAIFENTSAPPVETMGGATLPVYERPRIQVYVRSDDYSSARLLSDKTWKALCVVLAEDLGGVHYLRIATINSPEFFERDKNDRPIFSFSFEVWKELSV